MAINTGNLPPAPVRDPLIDTSGSTNTTWRNWFGQIYSKIGGVSSSPFTVSLSTDGTVGTVTYTTRIGRFSTLATLRLIEFDILISNWTGSPTGNVVVSGFPEGFVNDGASGIVSAYSKVTLGASHTQLGLIGENGQSYAYLYSSGSGSGVSRAKVPVANVATTARITGNILYSV